MSPRQAERLWTGDARRADLEDWASPRARRAAAAGANGPAAALRNGAGDETNGPGATESPGSAVPRGPRPTGRRAGLVAAGAVAGALLVAAVLGPAGIGGGEDERAPAARLPAVPSGSTPQTTAGNVYRVVEPGVVSVQAGSASGTGFLVDREGTIVTNAHVVGSATSATVRFGEDGDRIPAEVLGSDASTDLAALRIDRDQAGNPEPLALGDSDAVEVGDAVVAVGSPFGLDRTATAGIVSGLGREIEAPNGFQIDEVIQTDAAINPGNSGGPLADARGRVIGVNSQIATSGAGGNVGVGFAVPSNTVREVIPRLARGETIERGWIGVTMAEAGGGAAIEDVAPGGPADRAGLDPGRDVIVGVDGQPVRSPDDLSGAIADRSPGDTVRLEIDRDGERREVGVELRARPETAPGP
jgi:putative serine protease PepD